MVEQPLTTQWIRQTISDYIAGARENQLDDFNGQQIFAQPIVGVVDGDDPVFDRLREAVSEHHPTPREVLARSFPDVPAPTSVSVISWALPFTRSVCESNRSGEWPSRLYSAARNNGGALNFRLRKFLVDALCQLPLQAAAPRLASWYDAFRSDAHTFSSNWSERHVSYAAGLGRFGLTGGLITRAGSCVRLGSVVVGARLDPTERRADDHRAACLINGGAGCGRCIERCPVDAVSSKGLDKEKCYAMRKSVRTRFLQSYAGSMRLITAPVAKSGQRKEDYSLGCALCICGVPCEERDPYYTGPQ